MADHDQQRPPKVSEALGESEAFLNFQAHLSDVAQVDRPVLIVGERGTGKELVASRLHFLSPRWQAPLVTLNCAALAPSLIEAELFGHEAGAFTGAVRQRRGRFEAAEGGTLFLDEIGLIPMEVQEKILRVVEYKSFERVGGTDVVDVDVRIIGATNANLPRMVRDGQFKADLLDRLSFEVLVLPALRDRHGDVILLAHHFAARMAMELGLDQTPSFSDAVIEAMESHAWPGNVRELKNVVERAVYRAKGERIEAVEFDPFRAVFAEGAGEYEMGEPDREGGGVRLPPLPMRLAEYVREIEREAMQKAMREARHHQGEAAKLLGMTYHQFRTLYRKHGKEP